MKFNKNPYYSPEKCGLEIFEEVNEPDLSYEYNKLVIWKKLNDKTLWWDKDSGSSCPTPFEEGRHELDQITKDTFYNFDQALKNFDKITKLEYNTIKIKVKEFLKL